MLARGTRWTLSVRGIGWYVSGILRARLVRIACVVVGSWIACTAAATCPVLVVNRALQVVAWVAFKSAAGVAAGTITIMVLWTESVGASGALDCVCGPAATSELIFAFLALRARCACAFSCVACAVPVRSSVAASPGRALQDVACSRVLSSRAWRADPLRFGAPTIPV